MLGVLLSAPLTVVFAGVTVLGAAGCVFSARVRRWVDDRFELSADRSGTLDCLRAGAALWVFFFHLWQWNHGALDGLAEVLPGVALGTKGVPIFAAMSGYLIYRICSTKLQNAADIVSFARRRVNRIYPLYAATSVMILVLSGASLRSWVENIFMLPIFGIGTAANQVAWSVYVEETFYATCPFVALALRFIPAGRRCALLVAVLVSLMSVSSTASRQAQLWQYFVVGMLAYEARAHVRSWCMPFGLGFLAMDIYGLELMPEHGNPTGFTSLLAAALFFIIAAGANNTGVDRVFQWRFTRFLATVSYGIYMLQVMLVTEGVSSVGLPPALWIALKCAAIIGMASVAYLFIERPFLRTRPTLSGDTTHPPTRTCGDDQQPAPQVPARN